jgi:hypothetical protein
MMKRDKNRKKRHLFLYFSLVKMSTIKTQARQSRERNVLRLCNNQYLHLRSIGAYQHDQILLSS